MADATTVTPAPIFLNNWDLEIAVDGDTTTYDYGAAVSSSQFTPSTSTQTWKGGKSGSQFSYTTTPTWVLALTLADDITATTGFTAFLLANSGKTATVTFRPQSGGAGWQATVILVPAGLGGAVDAVGTNTVSLGVQGAPAPVTASTAA